ncbi:SCP2 domain-containing protein [Endozoicomonas sp. OPT23]|uniref:ubiquinone anaerobic biosynthesis accessory factor UbiT n=1 Tax=Endozoicomonas sp. OPT23 TaxID=2072845 RepID=UPI001891C9D9|nr:SCP2 sterol-binding domain-containing protein [Endozoicomonas sp. OPT23]
MLSIRRLLPTPALLAKPVRILPETVTHKPLEKLINHLLGTAIEEGEFDFLEDRWVKLTVTDLELAFYFGFDGEKLLVADNQQADVVFKGSSQAFTTLALRKEDPDTLFFQRKLMIEGDTELGLGLKNLLDSIDLEQLPPLARKVMATAMNISQRFTKH